MQKNCGQSAVSYSGLPVISSKSKQPSDQTSLADPMVGSCCAAAVLLSGLGPAAAATEEDQQMQRVVIDAHTSQSGPFGSDSMHQFAAIRSQQPFARYSSQRSRMEHLVVIPSR